MRSAPKRELRCFLIENIVGRYLFGSTISKGTKTYPFTTSKAISDIGDTIIIFRRVVSTTSAGIGDAIVILSRVVSSSGGTISSL